MCNVKLSTVRQWACKHPESLKYVLPASEPSEQGHSSIQIILDTHTYIKSRNQRSFMHNNINAGFTILYASCWRQPIDPFTNEVKCDKMNVMWNLIVLTFFWNHAIKFHVTILTPYLMSLWEKSVCVIIYQFNIKTHSKKAKSINPYITILLCLTPTQFQLCIIISASLWPPVWFELYFVGSMFRLCCTESVYWYRRLVRTKKMNFIVQKIKNLQWHCFILQSDNPLYCCRWCLPFWESCVSI